MFQQPQRPVSLRCSRDDINWPNHRDFKKCPLCGQATWRNIDTEPDLSIPEANVFIKAEYERRELHAKFEAYYQKREAQKAQEAMRRGVTDADLAELLK